MEPRTMEDRRTELRMLLNQIQAQPERDWTEERKRIAVLNQMLASEGKEGHERT